MDVVPNKGVVEKLDLPGTAQAPARNPGSVARAEA